MPRVLLLVLLVGCGAPPPPTPPPAAPTSKAAAPTTDAPLRIRGPRALARVIAPGDPALSIGLGARVGDLWMENPHVVALVAGPDHRMGPSSSGGALLHVGRRGATPRARLGAMVPVFDAAGQRAPLFGTVHVAQNGRTGGPAIVRMSGIDPVDEGVTVAQEVVIEPDAPVVRLITEVHNRTSGHYRDFRFGQFVIWGGLDPFVPGLGAPTVARSASDWIGAAGPASSVVFSLPFGRLLGVHGADWSIIGPKPLHLLPRARETRELRLHPGLGGEATAVGTLFAARRTVVGEVTGTVNVPGAQVELVDAMGRPVMRGRADEEGRYRLPARPGRLLVRAEAPGRRLVMAGPFQLSGSGSVSVPLELPAPSSLRFRITDARGGRSARLRVLLPNGRAADAHPRRGAVRAGDTILSLTGSGELALPPGDYRVEVETGPTHARAVESVQIQPGQHASLAVDLQREVDASGWFALDPHVAPPAGIGGTVLRAVDCAAAGIDGAVLLGDGSMPRHLGRPLFFSGLATADHGVGRFAGLPLQRAVSPLPVRARSLERLMALAGLPGAPLVAVLRPRSPGWGYFEHYRFDPRADALPRGGFSLEFQLLEVAVPGGRPPVIAALGDYLALLRRGRQVRPIGGSDAAERADRCGVARTWIGAAVRDAAGLRKALSDAPVVASFGPLLTVELSAGQASVRVQSARAHRPQMVRLVTDRGSLPLQRIRGEGALDETFSFKVPERAQWIVAMTDKLGQGADLAGFAVTSATLVPWGR